MHATQRLLLLRKLMQCCNKNQRQLFVVKIKVFPLHVLLPLINSQKPKTTPVSLYRKQFFFHAPVKIKKLVIELLFAFFMRRVRGSNSWAPFGTAGFQDQCHQPLGQPSIKTSQNVKDLSYGANIYQILFKTKFFVLSVSAALTSPCLRGRYLNCSATKASLCVLRGSNPWPPH